jgi:hypothetical protein
MYMQRAMEIADDPGHKKATAGAGWKKLRQSPQAVQRVLSTNGKSSLRKGASERKILKLTTKNSDDTNNNSSSSGGGGSGGSGSGGSSSGGGGGSGGGSGINSSSSSNSSEHKEENEEGHATRR